MQTYIVCKSTRTNMGMSFISVSSERQASMICTTVALLTYGYKLRSKCCIYIYGHELTLNLTLCTWCNMIEEEPMLYQRRLQCYMHVTEWPLGLNIVSQLIQIDINAQISHFRSNNSQESYHRRPKQSLFTHFNCSKLNVTLVLQSYPNRNSYDSMIYMQLPTHMN